MTIAQLQDALDAVFGRNPKQLVAAIEQRRKAKAAMANARRLALKHGIELERDRDGYWVTHPDFHDDDFDPLQGDHFCVGGDEVLAGVERYVESIKAKATT